MRTLLIERTTSKMKDLKYPFLGFLLLLFLKGSHPAETQVGSMSDDYDICEFLADGTSFRLPGYCDKVGTCKDHKTELKSTCVGGKTVLLKDLSCGKAADSYCSAPCSKSSPTYVQDPKNCQGWYKCDGSTMLSSGLCADGYYFDQSLQKCNFKDAVKCTISFEFCDVMPLNAIFVDLNNCHKYFSCNSKQNYVETTCPVGTYFDIDSGDCIKKSQVNCYKHPYPDEVCGTNKVPYRNIFVDDQATCRGYFFCRDFGNYTADATPAWGQCQPGYFFDETLQSCVPIAHVKCWEDRCDGIISGTTLSEKSGCQHYLECSNNSEMAEVKCPDDGYYDITLNQCTSTKQTYAACQ